MLAIFLLLGLVTVAVSGNNSTSNIMKGYFQRRAIDQKRDFKEIMSFIQSGPD